MGFLNNILGIGSNQSSTLDQTMDLVNQSMTDLTKKMVNNANVTCETVQDVSFSMVDAKIDNCDVQITSGVTQDCNLSAVFSSSDTTNLKQLMQSAIDNVATASQKSTQDFLATSSNDQNNNVNLSSQIKNIIATKVDSSISNDCTARASVKQSGKYNFDGVQLKNCPHAFVINTDTQNQVFAKCLVNNLTSLIASDEVANKLIQKGEAEQSSSQSGVGDIFKNLFNSWTYVLIGCCCLIAVVLIVSCIASALFASSGAGQNSINNAVNTAGNLGGKALDSGLIMR